MLPDLNTQLDPYRGLYIMYPIPVSSFKQAQLCNFVEITILIFSPWPITQIFSILHKYVIKIQRYVNFWRACNKIQNNVIFRCIDFIFFLNLLSETQVNCNTVLQFLTTSKNNNQPQQMQNLRASYLFIFQHKQGVDVTVPSTTKLKWERRQS